MSKEDNIYNAKLSEQAERYEDMVKYMKEIANSGGDLNNEERNLLSVAFKNSVGARRTAWRAISAIQQKEESKNSKFLDLIKEYKDKVEKELEAVCKDIVNILDEKLIPSSKEVPESEVFYKKMKGDYLRYLAECLTDSKQKEIGNEAMAAYTAAIEVADANLKTTHPIRLGLALNFSVFHYEIMSNQAEACKLAKTAFDSAIAELEGLDDDEYKDSATIMQLLRDNLTLWTTDAQDAGGEGDTEAVKSYDTTTKNTKKHEDLDSEYKLEKDNAAGDYKSITNRALIEARNIEYKLVEQMKPQDQKDNKLVMKSRLEEGIKLKDSEVNVNNQLSPNKVLENNIKISRSNIPNELGYLFGDEKIQLREESLTPGIPKTPANPEESYQMGMGRETQTKYQIKSAVLSTPIQTPSIKLSESNNLSKYMKRSQLRASKSPKTIIELEDRYIDLQRQILKGSQSSKMLLKNSEEKKPKVKGNMEKRKPKNEREYCKLPILNRPSMLTFDEDIHPNKQSKYSKIKAVSPSYQNLSKWSIPTKHWNNRMQHKIFEAGSRPPLHKTFIQNSTIAKLHINLRKQYIFEERVILEDKEEIPGRLAGC